MNRIGRHANRTARRALRQIARVARSGIDFLVDRPVVGRSVMVISLAILVMSQLVDWLEPAFGLSITAVLVAADIAALLVSGSAVLIERAALPALGRLWRRVSGGRYRMVNTLCGFSLAVLVTIALAHLHRNLRLDAWLGVLGAVLLPIGGLLIARGHPPQR